MKQTGKLLIVVNGRIKIALVGKLLIQVVGKIIIISDNIEVWQMEITLPAGVIYRKMS